MHSLCAKSALALALVVVVSTMCVEVMGAPATTSPETESPNRCLLMGNFTTGVRLLRKMMTGYYGGFLQLKRDIGSDLFTDNVVGMLQLYGGMLASLSNGSTSNGFPSLFAVTMQDITEQACQWLSSYPTFSTLDIDCSDPSQLIMMASFLRLRPMIESTLSLLEKFDCPPYDGTYEQPWLSEHLPSHTNELRQLKLII